jgi:hypothetical protein
MPGAPIPYLLVSAKKPEMLFTQLPAVIVSATGLRTTRTLPKPWQLAGAERAAVKAAPSTVALYGVLVVFAFPGVKLTAVFC